MSKKILALVTDAFGSYGGIAQYNCDLLNALAASDYVSRVTVLPRIANATFFVRNPKLCLLPPVGNKFAYAARALVLALTEQPDLIYNGHLYHGPLARCLASITRAKLVSQLHGTEVWSELRRRLLAPLEASDVVLCVSSDTEKRYLAQAAPGTQNAHVLPNTVGDEFVPGDRPAARRKFGISDEFVLLTVGRLDPRNAGYKGHERVIQALRTLERSEREIVYLIAGMGDDRERLERIAQDLGVTDNVRFLGKVPREDLPDLYRAADLFALPSSGEGFGIVYLEAMACGTPAIGLTVGGVPDALDHGRLGVLCDPDSFTTTLRLTIRSINLDEEDRADLARRVRKKFGRGAFRASVSTVLRPTFA